MGKKKILVDDLRLYYNGIFDMNELYREIDRLIADRGYAKNEKRSEEKVTEEGREISFELRPTKAFEKDFLGMVKMRFYMDNLTEAVVEKSGYKRKMLQGNIMVRFDGWTSTNIEFVWQTKPIFMFIRDVFDRLVYKSHWFKYEDEIASDTRYMHRHLKAFLNLYKY